MNQENGSVITDLAIDAYLSSLASSDSTPGGGVAAGLSGAQGAALLLMVANLTRGEKYTDISSTINDIALRCQNIMSTMMKLSDDDTRVFKAVMAAYQLPKSTDEEKRQRQKSIQHNLKAAAQIPLTMMQKTGELFPLANKLADIGNPNLISDVGIAVHQIEASLISARLNVLINIRYMTDAEIVNKLLGETETQMQLIEKFKSTILDKVEVSISRP